MSRKLFAFVLAELSLVRLKCGRCGKVAEMTIEELGPQMERPLCPFCQKQFTMLGGEAGPLVALATAIQQLKQEQDR